MDIYILRNGQETGPYSEATARSLVNAGSILMEDLAWHSGMPSWSPLTEVLQPAAKRARSAIEQGAPEVPQKKTEAATAKQKAFLSYVGTVFGPEMTKEEAAILVNEAMEDAKLHVRVAKWNEDRLKLHPELFTEEIQSRKENRAARFCEACKVEGANHFSDVTKAHCQVLVGYLDVRFPNWDAQEPEAIWGYFFPAVAEKFPQLVNKGWRGKLKYADGPKVAAELVTPKVAKEVQPRSNVPVFGPLIRGVVFGLVILIMLYVGLQFLGDSTPSAKLGSSRPAAVPAQPAAAPTNSEAPMVIRRPNSAPAVATGGDVAPAAVFAPSNEAPAMAQDPQSIPLFDEPATTPPAPAITPPPATPRPKTHLVVTKATEVRLPFGSAKLPAGTQLKIVSQAGSMVNALYTNNVIVQIPRSATDLAETAAP